MPRSSLTLAVLATAAFFALPSSGAVAQQSDGARPDQSAQPTDISAHRRWRYGWRPYWRPRAYYAYGYYGPYYRPYYRPYPYRYGYWGPRPFRYGPWW